MMQQILEKIDMNKPDTRSGFRLENCRIGFRNFRGEQSRNNKNGDRNFVVFLEPHIADILSNEGWNIKYPKDREGIDPELDDRKPFLKVNVSYKARPPKIVQIIGGRLLPLSEDQIGGLDFVEYDSVDLIISAYHYDVNGKQGISAYLKSLYINIPEDPFISKYGI